MPAHLNPWHVQTPEDDFAQGETEFKRERFERAVAPWLRAAASGHVEAQFRLGECYTRGRGVLSSLADAALWFKRAAQAGHREAQFRLGLLYLEGSQPDLGAETWLRTASEHDVKATKGNLELLSEWIEDRAEHRGGVQIDYQAGFHSIAAFNRAFRAAYG